MEWPVWVSTTRDKACSPCRQEGVVGNGCHGAEAFWSKAISVEIGMQTDRESLQSAVLHRHLVVGRSQRREMFICMRSVGIEARFI